MIKALTPQTPAAPPDDSEAEDTLTVFPHSETARYWISGQVNIILQWNPALPAKYSGPHSFGPRAQNATSRVYTLFLGYQLTHTTEVFLDAESAGGHGLSNALGLAGFTNLDVRPQSCSRRQSISRPRNDSPDYSAQ